LRLQCPAREKQERERGDGSEIAGNHKIRLSGGPSSADARTMKNPVAAGNAEIVWVWSSRFCVGRGGVVAAKENEAWLSSGTLPQASGLECRRRHYGTCSDKRGVSRPQGPAADIGAVEVEQP
jgi:hypothetical protein